MGELGDAVWQFLEDVVKSYGMGPIYILTGLAPFYIAAVIQTWNDPRPQTSDDHHLSAGKRQEVPVEGIDSSVQHKVVVPVDSGVEMTDRSLGTGSDGAGDQDEREEEEGDDEDDREDEDYEDESDSEGNDDVRDESGSDLKLDDSESESDDDDS